MAKSKTDLLGNIERNLWEVKSELASLAYLVSGLQASDGGNDLYGLGLILERHWKTLDEVQESVVDLFHATKPQ